MSGPAGPDWGADAALALGTDRSWDLLGTPVRVASTSVPLGRSVAELLDAFPASSPPSPHDRRYLLVDGCGRHGRDWCVHHGRADAEPFVGVAPMLSWLLTTLNHAAIGGFGGLAVHAGVVSSGRTVVAIPAKSGAGKTTLTAACLLAGFDYVSDEALCVGFAEHEIRPYPRALALSAWSRQAVGLDAISATELDAGDVALAPSRLGGRVAAEPLELAHVVNLVRRPGPSVLRSAARAESMAWLVARSFNHYKQPAAAFELTAELARNACAWRLEYGDPREAAALLFDRLA